MVNPNADPKPMSSLAALVSVAFVFVAVACTRPGATPSATGGIHNPDRVPHSIADHRRDRDSLARAGLDYLTALVAHPAPPHGSRCVEASGSGIRQG